MSSIENENVCPRYIVRMGPVAPPARVRRRGGERRADLRQVIRSLAAALLSRQDERPLSRSGGGWPLPALLPLLTPTILIGRPVRQPQGQETS